MALPSLAGGFCTVGHGKKSAPWQAVAGITIVRRMRDPREESGDMNPRTA